MSETPGTVRIGLAGFGYWGANLARNVDAARATTLAAVADPDAARRSAAAEQFGSTRVCATLAELLADPEVDAIALATPAPLHAEQALEGLRAGKHVLVEKPLAMNSDDAETLVKLAAESGLICMVGHTFLYSDPVRKLRDYVVSGEIGEVRYLYSQRLNLGRVRKDCNALWNFGPHDLSIIVYLLDERPIEVSARGTAFLQPEVDDVCFATLQFASGVVANIHVSWIDPRKTRLMTVVGNRKMVVYDDVSVDRKLSIFDSGVTAPSDAQDEFSSMGDFQWRTRPGSIEIPHLPLREPLLTEVEEFAAACRSGQPPLTDARHGADVVRILEAIDTSAKERGAPIRLEW